MLRFELSVIDWTAIGSIATTLAFVVAFIGISVSVWLERKNRNFQLLLQRKEKEQRILDEFIARVLDIFGAISALDVLNFSGKLICNSFDEKDRKAIEQHAINDELNSIKLNILITQSERMEGSKALIDKLEEVRAIYGHWARNINVLSMYLNDYDKATERAMVDMAMKSMMDVCMDFSNEYRAYIQDINKRQPGIRELCCEIVECYETITSLKLQKSRKEFKERLYEYVKAEQARINKCDM